MHNEVSIIKNEQLFQTYVSSSLEGYFYSKLKNEHPSYVKLKVCELLKFLTMAHNFFSDIPFNAEIDEVWHLWILQTVEYNALANKLPGKTFIHHSSNDYDDGKEKNSNELELNKQFSFLISYVANFGYFTEETRVFWPMVGDLMRILKLDLFSTNKYLHEIFLKKAG